MFEVICNDLRKIENWLLLPWDGIKQLSFRVLRFTFMFVSFFTLDLQCIQKNNWELTLFQMYKSMSLNEMVMSFKMNNTFGINELKQN